MKKRIVLIALGVVVVAAALIALYLTPEPQTYTDFSMGSVLTQTYWWGSSDQAILAAIQELELQLVNMDAPPELAIEIMEASNGAYNPYLGALTKLWDIDGEGNVPAQEEIEAALQKNELDLGAYGKGAACDEAMRVVMRVFGDYEIPCAAVINLGGNIMTYGQKPWGKPFKIALRDPNGGPNDTMGMFTLRGTHFISTSGSYEKYFEQDGERYHHIFDPETGYPACRESGLVSVTVINDNGALGDAISTACFVLGYEDSLDLLEQYNCDALFVYDDGEIRPVGRVMEYYEAR